jgi:hypothetical protein
MLRRNLLRNMIWQKNLGSTHDINMKSQIFSDSSVRIYVVPVPKLLRPDHLPFPYPSYSHDWGVEQDFDFAVRRSSARVLSPDLATHHYLPVFWTRYFVQNNYGKEGLSELNLALKEMRLDQNKLFTICQYDDGPLIDLDFGKGLFLASRKTEMGKDVPLLASPFPRFIGMRADKNSLLSFTGRTTTHEIRQKMVKEIGHLPGVAISTHANSTRAYYKSLLSTHVALAPRGYGGSSFRFFEAMQIATVPALIGDLDTRPFKQTINWDEISFFAESSAELYEQVSNCSKERLYLMGELAQKVYWEKLAFGRWTSQLWLQLLNAENN